jgi:hypothetical protein
MVFEQIDTTLVLPVILGLAPSTAPASSPVAKSLAYWRINSRCGQPLRLIGRYASALHGTFVAIGLVAKGDKCFPGSVKES